MDHQLEQIREQQKQSWDRFSQGWKKWDDTTMDFLKPAGDEIINLLQLNGDEKVLDIASGTGEPALTIAQMLKEGSVIATDLSEGMLQVAKQKAATQKLNNLEIRMCDATELPFGDEIFDAVSCRFGYMFFPDMLIATQEIVRVLKPGGRIATSVWNGPEHNFWITALMGTIKEHIEVEAPPPGAPSMFRCAGEGFMKNIFSKAGLQNVSQKEVSSEMEAESAEVYWEMMTEIGAPIVAALSKADDATMRLIKNEVIQKITEKFGSGKIRIPASALVVYGEK